MNNNIERLKQNWQKLGEDDPLWAVLSWPKKKGNKWAIQDFFKTGQSEIDSTMGFIKAQKISLDYERALDFGCGVGRLTQALGKYFHEVIGVDIAQAMIERATSLNSQNNCHFIVNSTFDLKIFPSNYFSFIYSRLTFQHMNPLYTHWYIQEFSRILKPNGIAVFGQPYKKNFFKDPSPKIAAKGLLKMILPIDVQNFVRNLVGKILNRPVMELYSMDKGKIIKWLESENFEVLRVDEFGDLGPAWVCYRYFIMKPGSND